MPRHKKQDTNQSEIIQMYKHQNGRECYNKHFNKYSFMIIQDIGGYIYINNTPWVFSLAVGPCVPFWCSVPWLLLNLKIHRFLSFSQVMGNNNLSIVILSMLHCAYFCFSHLLPYLFLLFQLFCFANLSILRFFVFHERHAWYMRVKI